MILKCHKIIINPKKNFRLFSLRIMYENFCLELCIEQNGQNVLGVFKSELHFTYIRTSFKRRFSIKEIF